MSNVDAARRPPEHAEPLFHLVERERWQRATTSVDGLFRADSLASEGFIHLSTASQWLAVANAFYRDASDLVLLRVDPRALSADLRFEAPAHPSGEAPAPITDGTDDDAAAERFPHLYGPLEVAAVTVVYDIPREGDRFVAPADLG